MSEARLPNIRVISVPVPNVIILNSIGSKLRSHYEDALYKPVPPQIDNILRQLN
ncbi:hypothetical protein [Microvirga calopogonii]|uniref:hypothetical protein n=1 Tax=Microvirga calopogonii TaxID=2078013 RepID=UPI0013B41638|nr:hypothetical protein [Microvirga calopogonii]